MTRTSAAPTNTLTQLRADAEARLRSSYPGVADQLIKSADQQLAQSDRSEAFPEDLTSVLTAQEHQEVLQKLASLCTLANELSSEEQLYLEQQLADVLGFSVSSMLNRVSLARQSGTVAACQHLKRTPTDTLAGHRIHAAGMKKSRSFLGWFGEHGTLTPTATQREEYWVSLPTSTFRDWRLSQREYAEWMKSAKVLLVNPFEERAVVCALADTFPPNMQFQLGASPETIREGLFWSKLTAGRALLFFVEDSRNSVQLGPVSIAVGSRA